MNPRPAHRMVLVRICALLLTPLVGVGFLGGGVASAQAYATWGYYQWTDGEWTFASTGPAGATPADGDVQGWRFAVSGESTPPRIPRAEGDFELICGSTPDQAGQKRVAVVIDYGVAAEAPQGQEVPNARGACATVEQDATGADVVAAVAEVRQEEGLICALDGYPAQGCGQPTEMEPANPESEPEVELELPETDTAEAAPDTGDNPADDPDGQGDNPAGNQGGAADTQSEATEPDGLGGPATLLIAGVALLVLIVLGGFLGVRRRSGHNGS